MAQKSRHEPYRDIKTFVLWQRLLTDEAYIFPDVWLTISHAV
jgi:hypothetical protein